MEKLKKQFALMTLVAMAAQVFVLQASEALAVSPGTVVINEVAWAGSADSANDEWIELYNNSGQDVDLSGWTIEDDGGASVYLIESGEIPARGYFLIEDSEAAVNNETANAVLGLSLANSGDSLTLKNAAGDVIDDVASGDGWYAGDGTSKATMERIDPSGEGDNEENWAAALSGNGSVASGGAAILGTPGGANSNFTGSGGVTMTVLSENPLVISVETSAVEDLYAYGFDVNYDPEVLEFVGASEASALDSDGAETSFFAGLENGIEGKLVVGNARLVDPVAGVDVSGELFQLEFSVIGTGEYGLSFGAASFLADSYGDLPVNFEGLSIEEENLNGPDTVRDLQVEEGDERYSLEVSWAAPENGAEGYVVYRVNAAGELSLIGETEVLSLIDDYGLVPGIEYEYRVAARKNGVLGDATTVTGADPRGLQGDNDRSDRVDARDLENLARAYGSILGDEDYELLVDTTFDGVIDGSDLIDIGANFGLTY